MKFSLALSAATLLSMNVHHALGSSSIKANSDIGKHILSKARRLEENDNDANEYEMQWVADYSLKFQGCHHVFQWNEEVDEDNDVRLYKKRLVRFRLCPSDTCSESEAGGCDDNFGDYVIDMGTYVGSYFEQSRRQLEEECKNYEENNCNCDDGDDDGNDNCLTNCYEAAEMDQCVEFVEEEENENQFQVENYLECAQLNVGGRRLEDGDANEAQYFVGPYCSGQGGKIYMGLFSDDTCTTFVDEDNEDGGAEAFESLTGYELPYSAASIVGEECFSCTEPDYDNDNNNNNNGNNQVEVNEACQVAYQTAGKCEYQLAEGTAYQPEYSACNYIDGIKIIREDGLVLIKPAHPNAVATAFTVIFAMAFAAMGFYVWYLRTRLGIKSDSLL